MADAAGVWLRLRDSAVKFLTFQLFLLFFVLTLAPACVELEPKVISRALIGLLWT